MRVLIIDNNIEPKSWGAQDLLSHAVHAPGATVTVRRAPQRDLPGRLDQYDRFIISGSLTSVNEQGPWIDDLENAIRRILDLRRPLLGVCYGHQMIARTLGGMKSVRKSPTPEYGWTSVELLTPSPLFAGLSNSFYSFSSHFDEICELPKGLVRVARSNLCDVQAFQMADRPVYGIQFHPEKPLAKGEAAMSNRKKLGTPKQLLHFGEGKKLYDPKVGETIFRNFLK